MENSRTTELIDKVLDNAAMEAKCNLMGDTGPVMNIWGLIDDRILPLVPNKGAYLRALSPLPPLLISDITRYIDCTIEGIRNRLIYLLQEGR